MCPILLCYPPVIPDSCLSIPLFYAGRLVFYHSIRCNITGLVKRDGEYRRVVLWLSLIISG